ncbi:hypothetical protein ACFP56_18275 [Paenibacillus septentrionalis]|uniref:YtkA-like domain-containing protein n=1 Tax=Paenibacillus septentrionalis TaxID=429342 RepID=A0ABW1VAQ5_9BACL
MARTKAYRILCMLVLVSVLLGCAAGCSNEQPMQDELELMPFREVEAELTAIPEQPVAGEPATVRVRLLEEEKPTNGMRIELRNNARETRLYDAKEIEVDDVTYYEIEAVFENQGENLVTLHFNLDSYHIMSSLRVEVK